MLVARACAEHHTTRPSPDLPYSCRLRAGPFSHRGRLHPLLPLLPSGIAERLLGGAPAPLCHALFPHGTFPDRMSLHLPESSMDVYELLDRALMQFSPREVGLALGVDPKTVRRWHARETEPKPYVADAIRQRLLP